MNSFDPYTIISPEFISDSNLILRVYAPKAEEVKLGFETLSEMIMQKDDNEVWSVEIGPLKPRIYTYSFKIDGVTTVDPRNPFVKAYASSASYVEVIGDGSAPWTIKDVEHGAVHTHFYKSESANAVRRFHIYTPPGYSESKENHPVLILMHGYGDDDSSWTSFGRANMILDNFIAEGKTKPMIVVMPYGHIYPAFKTLSEQERISSTPTFEKDVLEDVMRFVEKEYRIADGKNNHAIAGLSMGGAQSMILGFNNIDKFNYIGAFSAGNVYDDDIFASIKNSPNKPKLFWMGIGKDDFLIKPNVEMHEKLMEAKIEHTWVLTEGTHSWYLWREYFAEFVQLLFK